jgi:AhpD family alkylhydroperoxidase
MKLNTYEIDPKSYEHLIALGEHLASGSLDAGLRALVETRASQINGCAFCLAMHADEARRAGVPQFKLDTVAGWRDTDAFHPAERAALELTEAMTRVADVSHVDDAVWNDARDAFDDATLTTLVMAIALINTWNRLNIATGRTAEDYEAYARRTARIAERAANGS